MKFTCKTEFQQDTYSMTNLAGDELYFHQATAHKAEGSAGCNAWKRIHVTNVRQVDDKYLQVMITAWEYMKFDIKTSKAICAHMSVCFKYIKSTEELSEQSSCQMLIVFV